MKTAEKKRVGLLGRKVGMTTIFSQDGEHVPVTVIQAGPCVVVRKCETEKDGYDAVQIGFEEIAKAAKVNKPAAGHYDKAGVKPHRVLREIPSATCMSLTKSVRACGNAKPRPNDVFSISSRSATELNTPARSMSGCFAITRSISSAIAPAFESDVRSALTRLGSNSAANRIGSYASTILGTARPSSAGAVSPPETRNLNASSAGIPSSITSPRGTSTTKPVTSLPSSSVSGW